jgi:hypothetical protein
LSMPPPTSFPEAEFLVTTQLATVRLPSFRIPPPP